MKNKDIINFLKKYDSEMEIDEIRIDKNDMYIKAKLPLEFINVTVDVTPD